MAAAAPGLDSHVLVLGSLRGPVLGSHHVLRRGHVLVHGLCRLHVHPADILGMVGIVVGAVGTLVLGERAVLHNTLEPVGLVDTLVLAVLLGAVHMQGVSLGLHSLASLGVAP
eukprot:scaffold98323_cov41-Cyclotella_meneghiniana.AAC.2